MPSEVVLYTTLAAVLQHRQDVVLADPGGSAGVVETTRSRRIQPSCTWRLISCGALAHIHICAEIDRYTSEARFRIVVWVLESGAIVVNDVLGAGCSWWRSAHDDTHFRRLAGVDNHTYGFQFRSSTKAIECSRIIDHILTDTPGVLEVVKKLMRANVDLQSLVMAWQGFGLHSISIPSRAPRIHSETTSSSPASSCPELMNGQRTLYPKEHEVSYGSAWHEDQQSQQLAASGRVVRTPTDARSSSSRKLKDNQEAVSLEDASVENSDDDNQVDEISNRVLCDDNNQVDEMSDGAPTSSVALLETDGANDTEARVGFENKRSIGEWISRPYKTRGEIHVTYNMEQARYEGLPDEWRMLNHQFGLPLEEVPRRVVEGYDTKLPAVLEMMKTCFLAHNGARTEGVFRVAPEKEEFNAVKQSINDGTLEDCSDVHIMASLIKVWFRELPVSLFNMLPEANISLACSLVNPEPTMVLQTLSALPKLHESVVLWLLDLLNEVTQYEQENKMTAKSMAIVMSPNLLSVESSDVAVVVAAYRQAADFMLALLHARAEQRAGR